MRQCHTEEKEYTRVAGKKKKTHDGLVTLVIVAGATVGEIEFGHDGGELGDEGDEGDKGDEGDEGDEGERNYVLTRDKK